MKKVLSIAGGIIGVNGIEALLLVANTGENYTYSYSRIEAVEDIESFLTSTVETSIVNRILDGDSLEDIAAALYESEELEVESYPAYENKRLDSEIIGSVIGSVKDVEDVPKNIEAVLALDPSIEAITLTELNAEEKENTYTDKEPVDNSEDISSIASFYLGN